MPGILKHPPADIVRQVGLEQPGAEALVFLARAPADGGARDGELRAARDTNGFWEWVPGEQGVKGVGVCAGEREVGVGQGGGGIGCRGVGEGEVAGAAERPDASEVNVASCEDVRELEVAEGRDGVWREGLVGGRENPGGEGRTVEGVVVMPLVAGTVHEY